MNTSQPPRGVTVAFCRVTLRGHKPFSPGYLKTLKTIGDHIRKSRLDLKLTQKELAERLGVDKTTIQFWENSRVGPSLAKMLKIIEFLGYDPSEKETENLGDKIRKFRRAYGLSQKRLAKLLGVDQTTLSGWERRGHIPQKRQLEKLMLFFASYHSSVSKPEE